MKIFESTIILEYIENKYPDVPLRPAVAARRAKARMIEDLYEAQYEAMNWGMGETATFKRADGKLAQKLRNTAKRQARQIQGWLVDQLGEAEWFDGEKSADVCVWPSVNRSTSYGLQPSPGTPLRNWYERAKQRSSMKSVFEEYSAGVQGVAAAYESLQRGLLKKEYHDHWLERMIKSDEIGFVQGGLQKDNIRFQWPS